MNKYLVSVAFQLTCASIVAAAAISHPKEATAASSAAPAAGGVSANAITARIDAEGHRVLGEAKESTYSHKQSVDEAEGSFNLDCSSLASYILKNAAPNSLAQVPKEPGKKRPKAVQFYETFASAGTGPITAWQKVPRIGDARPGDFIAWQKLEAKPGDNTGHIVMLDSVPAKETRDRYRVEIIDSTETPHAMDTRAPGQSGVGRGTLWFITDAAGQPTAFLWSDKSKQPKSEPIAIGRAVDAPAH